MRLPFETWNWLSHWVATSGRSLLDVIDETVTGMGARLLRSWMLPPCGATRRD